MPYVLTDRVHSVSEELTDSVVGSGRYWKGHLEASCLLECSSSCSFLFGSEILDVRVTKRKYNVEEGPLSPEELRTQQRSLPGNYSLVL